MKKLNFDYNLYDANGNLSQKGHINYSISHFIYVQYQKTYLQYTGRPMPSPKHFWNNFNTALNVKNIGNIFFAFSNNQPQMLNKTSKIGAMQIMQAFGYFAFHDILGVYPIFTRKNKRIYLVDPSFQNGMSFHFSTPTKQPTQAYSKLFMSTFISNGAFSLVNEQGTFSLKIVDPVGTKKRDDTAAKSYFDNKNKVLEDLNGIKEFSVKTDNVNLNIYISKTPIADFDGKLDSYTDGEIYIYVKENLKVSNYIHFIDDERFALSLRTSSLIKLDEAKYIALKSGNFSIFDENEIISLKKMLFLVCNIDEYQELQERRKVKFKKARDTFDLTILTTTDCNARCHYCYEKGIQKEHLSLRTQQRIIDIIKEQFSRGKKIHISWFGGEPLLNVAAIKNISSELNKHDVVFSASMVSNGYLVDKYIDIFDPCKIGSIQITLDGINEKYNNTKKYVYKQTDAFSRVINNIRLLLNKNIKVNIRLNFNKENYLDILECIDFIRSEFGNHEKLNVYASHIFGSPDTYHLDDGTNIYSIIYKKLIDCKYAKSLIDIGLKVKDFYCFVTNLDNHVINANGEYYICEHAVRMPEIGKVGNVFSGIEKNSNYIFWTSMKYPYKKCQTCSFIYICQGGCKSSCLENKDSTPCLPYLDCIDEIIKYYYERRCQ